MSTIYVFRDSNTKYYYDNNIYKSTAIESGYNRDYLRNKHIYDIAAAGPSLKSLILIEEAYYWTSYDILEYQLKNFIETEHVITEREQIEKEQIEEEYKYVHHDNQHETSQYRYLINYHNVAPDSQMVLWRHNTLSFKKFAEVVKVSSKNGTYYMRTHTACITELEVWPVSELLTMIALTM
jgi:hypothetical protein